jgi:septal ring factor EnvC (AmiA/AmiB activator)
MKKYLRWIVIGAAFSGMGIAMPSCPGQQAMQQQLDTLQTSNAELTKKVQSMQAQLTSINSDMGQVKQLLPQMTNVIQAQKGALEQLDATVKSMQSKSGKSAKAAPKKKK